MKSQKWALLSPPFATHEAILERADLRGRGVSRTNRAVTDQREGSRQYHVSREKKEKLHTLQQEFEELKNKIRTVEVKNEKILDKLKLHANSPPQRDASRKKSSVDNPSKGLIERSRKEDDKKQLRHNIDVFRERLGSKALLPADRSDSDDPEDKEIEYQRIIRNQEEEIKKLKEALANPRLPEQIMRMLEQLNSESERVVQLLEQKLRTQADRLNKVFSLARRCSRRYIQAKQNRRNQSQRQFQSLKEKQIELIISEFQRDQKKLREERRILEDQVDRQRSQLDGLRDGFDIECKDIKERYLKLMADSEDRFQKELKRVNEQMLKFVQEKESLSERLRIQHSASSRLNRKLKELEAKKKRQEESRNDSTAQLEEYRFQIEGLKEIVNRINSEKDQLAFELEKQKLNRTLNAAHEEQLEEYRSEKQRFVQQVAEANEAIGTLKLECIQLQRDNFQLTIKQQKQEELRGEIEEVYKRKLMEESRQASSFREDNRRLQNELEQVRHQKSSLTVLEAQLLGEIKKSVELFDSIFLRNLYEQYKGEPVVLAIETLRGLCELRVQEASQADWIRQTALKKNWLAKLREQPDLKEVVKDMGQCIDELRMHSQSEKENTRRREEKILHAKEKYESEIRKNRRQIADLTDQLRAKELSSGEQSNEEKLRWMKQQNEKLELQSKLEILQFELKGQKELFEEQLHNRDKTIAERCKFIADLQQQIHHKEEETEKQRRSRTELEEEFKIKLKQKSEVETAALQQQSQAHVAQVEAIHKERTSILEELKASEGKVHQLQRTVEGLESCCLTLESELDRVKQQLTGSTDELKLANKQTEKLLSELTTAKKTLEKQLSQEAAQRQQNQKKEVQLKQQIRSLQRTNEEHIDFISKLNQEAVLKGTTLSDIEERERKAEAAYQQMKQLCRSLQKQLAQKEDNGKRWVLQQRQNEQLFQRQTKQIESKKQQIEELTRDIVILTKSQEDAKKSYEEKCERHVQNQSSLKQRIDQLNDQITVLIQKEQQTLRRSIEAEQKLKLREEEHRQEKEEREHKEKANEGGYLKQIDDYKGIIKTREEEAQQNIKKLEYVETELAREKEKTRKITEELDEAKLEIVKSQAKINQLEEERIEIIKGLEEGIIQDQQKEQEVEKLKEEKIVREAEYFNLIQEQSKLKEDLTETQDLLEQEQQKTADLTEQKNTLTEANSTLKAQGDQLQTLLKETIAKFEKQQANASDLNARIKTLTGQLNVESVEKTEAGEKLRQYEEKTAELAEKNAALEQAMKIKDNQSYLLKSQLLLARHSLTQLTNLVHDKQELLSTLELKLTKSQLQTLSMQQKIAVLTSNHNNLSFVPSTVYASLAPSTMSPSTPHSQYSIADDVEFSSAVSPSQQTQNIDFFLRVKSELLKVLNLQEPSVEFYSLLPVELEAPFEELIASVREKVTHKDSLNQSLPAVSFIDVETSLSTIQDLEAELNAVLERQESPETTELKAKIAQLEAVISEFHQKSMRQQLTIQHVTQELEEIEEQNETRHIAQLSVLKTELKETKARATSLEMMLDSSKSTTETEEDLAEAFGLLSHTAQLTAKEKTLLSTYEIAYAKQLEAKAKEAQKKTQKKGWFG